MKKKELDIALRAIVKSSVLVFLFLIFSKLITYFYRIVIARHFGPEVYGSLSLAIGILGIFTFLAVFGLDEGLLRFIPFYRQRKQNKKILAIFHFSFKFVLCLSLLLGLIMFLISKFIAEKFFHSSSLTLFFQMFSLLVPLCSLTRLYLSSLRAFEKIGWYSFLTNFIEGFFRLVFLVVFIFIGLGSFSVSFSYVLGTIILFVGSLLSFKSLANYSFKGPHLLKKNKSELINYSWPMMFSFVIGTIFSWIDSFMIGYFKTASEVGLYNAAMPLAALLVFIPGLFLQLFSPMINRLYSEKNIMLIKNLSQQIGKWIFVLNLPIFIILVLFPGVLLNFLFGSEYISASTSLIFLSIGEMFYAQFSLSANLLNMLKKSKLNLINVVVSSILNILLNLLFVPKYGINGASFATMLSIIFLTSLYGIEGYYFIGILPIRRKMFNIFCIGLLSVVPILILRKIIENTLFNIILVGILFFLVYLILIILTKGLDRNDLMILKYIRNKLNL
jgi:O-antigen/teichoic acid export membrane protein